MKLLLTCFSAFALFCHVHAGSGSGSGRSGSSGTMKNATTAKTAGYWQLSSGSKYCEIVDGGRCVTDGAGNYGSKESCRVLALRPLFVYAKQYEVETKYDYLTVNGVQYKYGSAPNGVKMAKGAALDWRSDGSGHRLGWKVCAEDKMRSTKSKGTTNAYTTTKSKGTTNAYTTTKFKGTTNKATTAKVTTNAYTTTKFKGTTNKATTAKGSKYKYVAQDFGKNSCPQGTLVDTEAECKQAALALKKRSPNVFSHSSYPKGCFVISGYSYFNKHSTGGGSSEASPVCRLGTKECQTLANWTLGFPTTNTSYMEKTTNHYSSKQFADKVTNQLSFRVQRANATWMNIVDEQFHHDIKYQLVDYTPFAPRTNAEFLQAARQCSRKINCAYEGPYGPMEDWVVSDVTSMESALHYAQSFNGDISKWDVSNVKNTLSMFNGARSFNIDISKWNVAKVTDMRNMFYMATSFTVDLSSWNVWKVADVSYMFYRAYAYKHKLCSPAWLRVQKEVKNHNMFTYSSGKISCEKDRFAPKTRKELNAGLSSCFKTSSDGNCAKGEYNKQPPIGDWDVSNVQDLSYLFYQKSNFKADISKWNVANATNMEGMFAYAHSFNSDISKWDVSNVGNMEGMFYSARSFNVDLSDWDVYKVFNMEFMFAGTASLQQTICGHAWVTSKASRTKMFKDSRGQLCDGTGADSAFQKYSKFRKYGFNHTSSSTGLILKAKQSFVEFGTNGKVKMFNADAITLAILAAGGVDIPSTLRTQDLEIAGVSLENYVKNIVLQLLKK